MQDEALLFLYNTSLQFFSQFCCQNDSDTMADAPKTQYLKSEHNAGQVTAYRVYEKRSGRSTTPLVMIQGLSAVGTIDYHDLAQALSKNRTVVTFDNRDIGESTWGKNPSPFTLEDLARDVAHLIQVS